MRSESVIFAPVGERTVLQGQEQVDRQSPPLVLIRSLDVPCGALSSQSTNTSLVHSHWSRNVEAWLSLVERIIVLQRQLSYAIKNQLIGIYGIRKLS